MSLSQAISNGNQGLSAAARATDIVSSNLANAQTDGYVRRSVIVSERIVAGKGLGLNPVLVKRNEAVVASNNVRRSENTYQQQKALTDATKVIQQAIGNVDDEYSLTARMDSFRNSLKSLSETPESASLQDQTIFEAKEFARTIRSVATSIQEIRESADSTIQTEVNNLNNYLVRLKDVNGDIASLGSSSDVAALQDEQERLLNQINQIIPVNVTQKETGVIGLSTKTGVTLLDINIAKIEFNATSFITPDKIYSYKGDEPGLPYSSVLSGLTVSEQDITPTANKIQSITGGKLGGLFEVRDKLMITMQKQLDSIAGHFITSFRNVDNTTDINADMVNGDVDSLFTAGNSGASYNTLNEVLGVANRFTVNSKFDSSVGGDKRRIREGAEATNFTGAEGNATLIQAWIQQTEILKPFDASTDLARSQSLISVVREFVSSTTLKNQNQLNSLEYEEGRMNQLLDIRDNAEGVNIDEQTQQMLFLQKIYQANAVLIKTAGEMFDTILSIAG